MPRGGARANSGPEKQFETRIILRLSTEQLAAVDAIILEGETRSDVIRRALEREVTRCLKIHAKAGAKRVAAL